MKKICFMMAVGLILTAFGLGSVAQNLSPDQGYSTPGGAFDHVFDMYGNKFSLQDLSLSVRQKANARTNSVSCTSGYFTVYFEAGCGMDGSSAIEVERRNAICQLFTDLSNFIVPANSATPVNIWVRNIANVPGVSNPALSGLLGLATAFYVLPNGAASGGIADNEIWKTINSGKDSYSSVSSPLSPLGIGQTSSGSYYHGYMAFNFSNVSFNWHSNITQPTPTGMYDLYTIALHEVTHALGFASLINYNGLSKFGAGFNYYSRYDKFLKTQAGQPLITNTGGCSQYQYAFNSSLSASTVLSPNPSSCGGIIPSSSSSDNTTCSTAINFVGSVTQNVYTPGCFEPPSSLSHFEDQCQVPATFVPPPPASNNLYFLMSNANGTGATYMKRYMKPEERSVLCDLGYKVNTSYGNTMYTANSFNYGGSVCPGLQVAGTNDGITSTGSYAYIGNSGTGISISNVLANDFNAVSFECMQVVSGAGTLSATSGTSCTYTPSVQGVHLLRYVPVSSSGSRGNITYVFVYAKNPNCTPSACNLVNNGGFESGANCGQTVFDSPLPTMDCWEVLSGSPEYYVRGCTSSSQPGVTVPTPFTTPASDTWNNGAGGNNKFMGLWARKNQTPSSSNSNDALQCFLSSPIQPATSYTLSFRARVANSYPAGSTTNSAATLVFGGSASMLALTGSTYSSTPSGITTLTTVTVPPNNQWNYFSVSVTSTSSSSLNVLEIIHAFYMNTANEVYVLLDDVSLLPLNQTVTFTPPSPACIIPDLSQYVSSPGGVFSGPGVSLSGGIYSFNGTTAGGAGTYTIHYTYTNNLGCSSTVTATITVQGAVLSMQDATNDNGSEPNMITTTFFLSQDIWVRNAADGMPTHQNPLGTLQNYVYVNIRNIGCAASAGTEELTAYWAKASTGLYWPSSWINDVVAGLTYGDKINPTPLTIPVIASGGITTLMMPWTPPDPHLFTPDAEQRHFCLLGRIERTTTAPYGMTYAENSSTYYNTMSNNNVIWRNITLMDANNQLVVSNGKPVIGGTVDFLPGVALDPHVATGGVYVGNPTIVPRKIKLKFEVPGDEIDNSVLKYGNVKVNLGPALFQKWITGGATGDGIVISPENIPYTDAAKVPPITTITITKPHAWIGNITLSPGERDAMITGFGFGTKIIANTIFHYSINQYDDGPAGEAFIGGEGYEVIPPNCPSPIITTKQQGIFTTLVVSALNPLDIIQEIQWFLNGDIVAGATNYVFVSTDKGIVQVRVRYRSGCSAFSTVQHVDPNSLNRKGNTADNFEMLLHPNPSKGATALELNLIKSGDVRIEVTDISGKVISSVLQQNLLAGEHTFQVGNELKSGIYMIKVSSEGTVKFHKLVIMEE